jgi:hypothetical protein
MMIKCKLISIKDEHWSKLKKPEFCVSQHHRTHK